MSRRSSGCSRLRSGGKGLASEGACEVQTIAKIYLAELSLISLIGAENHSSIALAEAVGATFDRDLDFRGSSVSAPLNGSGVTLPLEAKAQRILSQLRPCARGYSIVELLFR